MKSLLRYSNQQSKTQLPRKRNTYLNDRIIPSLQVRLQAQAKPAPGEKLMFTGTLDCAYKTVKNEVCEDVGRGWWGEFQSSSHHLLSPSPLTISSHHLLSTSPLTISSPSPLTISHHLLSPSLIISSHHLSYRLLSLYLSSSPLTISSHHLLLPSLVPSPLTVSLTTLNHHHIAVANSHCPLYTYTHSPRD